MTHVPHDLHDEFPGDGEVLHSLKISDRHFRMLAARYHGLAREIHRIEAGVEAAGDSRLEDLKKHRLALLDEVAQLISRARAA